MSATDTLNKVRTLLGLETKLEQMKLDNGTLLEADKFEKGQPVFIVTEDEKVALPVGTYKMENGLSLSVKKEGIIAKMAEETEEVIEEVTEETEDMGYVSREEFELALEEIKKMIDNLKPEEEEEEKEVETKEKEEEEVEEMSEQAKLKAELSKPASAPIKHNPEAKNSKKFNFKYANNKKLSTFDIVLQKLNK